MLSSVLGRLKWVGYIESGSFLILLLIAMPLKYLANDPSAVKVVGAAHGFLWIVYLLALLHATIDKKWGIKYAVAGFIASVIPLGPLFYDRWLAKEGYPA